MSFILSVNFASNWFAMGFSPTGAMIGSSALVGYISPEGGDGVVKQYYLAGKTSDQVFVHQGNLSIVPNTEVVTLHNQTMYMAFQVDMETVLTKSKKVIYAYGYSGIYPNSSGYIEGPHRATFETSLDFSTGSSIAVASDPITKLIRIHGTVSIVAWQFVVSLGAFIARYGRGWGSVCFRIHVISQVAGYLLGIAGAAIAIQFTRQLSGVVWHNHRIFGIVIIVMASMQVLAICARPKAESKYRNAWMLCHVNLGRVLLLCATVNALIGLNLANNDALLMALYIVTVSITVLAFLIFEILHQRRIKSNRQVSAQSSTTKGISNYEMMQKM
ncbi:hypothetical protein KP509_04G015900 [Ceratopteris richardii]|nr:hypothetical protein KP509_04G015900 [Ceratopteris richardii]